MEICRNISKSRLIRPSEMYNIKCLILFYLLTIPSPTELSGVNIKNSSKAQLIPQGQTYVSKNLELLYHIFYSPKERRVYNKITWNRKREKLKLRTKPDNAKYTTANNNNNYESVHNIKKRQDLQWLDDYKRRDQENRIQVEREQREEQEKRTKELQKKANRLQARETSIIFTLIGVLIIIGITICLICKRATRKFERNSREIQNFLGSELNEQRNIMNDDERNIEHQNINATNNDWNYVVLSNQHLVSNSDLNVQTAHLNHHIDLPPTYEEAMGNTLPRIK